MTNYDTTTQRSSATPPLPPSQSDEKSKGLLRKKLYTIAFLFPFDIPSSPESAAVRIVRNLERFGLYYATFIWTVLFISLIPERKVSVVCLVATTEVAFLYSLLLRALPDSFFLHRVIDKRVVFFLLFVATAVEMILTEAALHLFIVLVAATPVIALLAVLTKGDDDDANEEAGEMARLVEEKMGDEDVAALPETSV